MFGARTVVGRVPAGVSRVTTDGLLAQTYMLPSGLACSVITNPSYPARVAVSLAKQLVEQFDSEVSAWSTASEGAFSSWKPLADSLVKFQTPSEADKYLRVRAKLDATKATLISTIDDVLKRGEKLEDLMKTSTDLSEASKKFYKEARKTDSCCAVM